MKKFHQTTAISIYNEFDVMHARKLSSLITVFYLIQYFKFKKLLEVGFYKGQTFGIMLEATLPGSELVTLDPIFKTEIYDKYYRSSKYVKDKRVDLLETTFENFNSTETYDFIFIDSGMPDDDWMQNPCDIDVEIELDVDRGDHLIRSLNYVHDDTILMLDDFRKIPSKVDKFLNAQSEFVPFLVDDQSMYFHKKTHNASDFLDNFLESQLSKSFSLYNIDHHDHLVKWVNLNTLIDLRDFKELWLDIFKIKNI